MSGKQKKKREVNERLGRNPFDQKNPAGSKKAAAAQAVEAAKAAAQAAEAEKPLEPPAEAAKPVEPETEAARAVVQLADSPEQFAEVAARAQPAAAAEPAPQPAPAAMAPIQSLTTAPWFFVDMWANLIADSCSFWIASLTGLREIAKPAGATRRGAARRPQPYPSSSSSSSFSSVVGGV
jgi:hypothetical protein